jgi:predicted RNA-binding Zn-ribbon protein involved in translation (DUF1610 family)
MTAKTLLDEIKSKQACLNCQEKKLTTNDSERSDELMHYRCLNCGYDYTETKEERSFRDGKNKMNRTDDSPWGQGATILIAMLATILIINLSGQNGSVNVDEPRIQRDSLQQPQRLNPV